MVNVVFFFLALFGTDTSRPTQCGVKVQMEVYLMSAGSHGHLERCPERCPNDARSDGAALAKHTWPTLPVLQDSS